jgi:hypothetical protein
MEYNREAWRRGGSTYSMILTLVEMPQIIVICLRDVVLHSAELAAVGDHQREAWRHLLRRAPAISAATHEK